MLVKVPIIGFLSLRLKNYFIVFNGIEYVIRASFIADKIVETFRPLSPEKPEIVLSEALFEALDLMNRAKFADADKLITDTLDKVSLSQQCSKPEAQLQFSLLLLQAKIYKKWKDDRKRELELLNQCAEIAKKHEPLFPPKPIRPETISGCISVLQKYSNSGKRKNNQRKRG